ncbi:MAG: S24/S26 family peptidase [Oscillospiraceae bacterium]|nr:S24/S26 family peptidase [Oscillospiraceae bacterium]
MEHKVRVIEPQLLTEQLPQLLQEAESVPLVISGSSMVPFLVHGRDTVYLSKVAQPLKKGDMIFYRRRGGQYVLHRICKVRDGSYDLVGDGQVAIERGIRPEQILAVVKAVRRKGKLLRKGSFLWEFFEHIWLVLRPFRPGIIRVYSCMTGWRRQK